MHHKDSIIVGPLYSRKIGEYLYNTRVIVDESLICMDPNREIGGPALDRGDDGSSMTAGGMPECNGG